MANHEVKQMEFGTYYEPMACELRAAVGRYYDKWVEVPCKDEGERQFYATTVEQKRITVVLFACAVVENAINFCLGLKYKTSAEFADVERKSILKKWMELAKMLAPAYDLPINCGLYQDLNALVERRNAIMHAKPNLSIEGDNRHAGNEPPCLLDENEIVERCVSLPSRLLEHLLSFDQASFPAMSNLTMSCGAVMREVRTGGRMLEYLNVSILFPEFRDIVVGLYFKMFTHSFQFLQGPKE